MASIPTSFDIGAFKANIFPKNIIKSTNYNVFFTGSGLNNNIIYRTERVELPDVSLDTEKIRRYGYGPIQDVPFRPVFQPLRITLIAPADTTTGIVELVKKISGTTPFVDKSYSMTNSNNMNISVAGGSFLPKASPYEVAYKDDIKFTTNVSLFGVNGDTLFTYIFNDCFLRSMSPIDLSWGATDQYVKVDMTIGYTDFYLT